MPELPEVETIARTLSPHIVGKIIHAIHILNDKTWQGDIVPKRIVNTQYQPCIQATGRRGKLLLIYLEYPTNIHQKNIYEDDKVFALAFHLKMTGRVFTYPQQELPHKHTRIIIDLDDGTRIFFDDIRKFGYVRALSKKNILNWDFWKNLGPDPFEIEKTEFVTLFCNRNASIKSLLLNQQILSGIGNIYADEGLFRAGIHPKQQASTLSTVKLEKLYHCIIDVLEESIQFCGSSIRDYRTANGDVGSFQNKFYVYNRTGQQCKICNNSISKITVAGRTTHFCPCCQNT